MTGKHLAALAVLLLFSSSASSMVTLVQTNDPGWYNNSIGTVLNGTNGGEPGPFPVSDDRTASYPEPDLSAANSALGNWLSIVNTSQLNSNWGTGPIAVPNSWAVGTEVAVIYQFNTLNATNVVARFGVDNGIYAWLNGDYIGGSRAGGGVSLGEHTYNIGDLEAGTYFLQLLLEDHGSANGYAVEITADEFIEGPPPAPIPVPAAIWLFGSALMGLGFSRFFNKSRT